jgi:signal transduction histidine kinase
LLLRWRWWLGGAIGVAFAVGQLSEALLLRGEIDGNRLLFDMLLWGALGGIAVWLSLTWASRQEQRHRAEVEDALQQQQALNQQLERANGQLALLSNVNRRMAASASLDEIVDAALQFPQQLVEAKMAALWLVADAGPVLTRTSGASAETIQQLRQGYVAGLAEQAGMTLVTLPNDPDGLTGACLRVPLQDGALAVGWIELYLARKMPIAADEWALLQTIAGEIGEVITSVRRRTREERAIYELEQAIAEERARIARDIHDGLAQTLAFRRMRVDLWLDWLESDPVRLRAELVGLKTILREQIAELRRAIFALRPIQFDDLGFVGGMHRYIMEFGGQQGWSVQVDLSGLATHLSPALEAVCFRLVQEALTNVAKHAQASVVTVTSIQVDGGLQLVVQDNGHGFDVGAVEGMGQQLGLRQMRERLSALHGRLTILSQPGAGTELRVWLPLAEKEKLA